MATKPAALRHRLQAFEHELQRDLRRAQRQLRQRIPSFLRQSQPLNVLSAPVIYSMIVPIAILDVWVSIYQWICFPLFGIDRVRRGEFIVIDRCTSAITNS